MQVAHSLFYSQIPVIKRIIHHTRSDDRTAVLRRILSLSRLSGLQWLSLSALAGIRKEKLQLTCDEESISKFRKNEDNVIYFCRHCGSWLFSVVRNGEFAHVRLGILIYQHSSNLSHLRRFQGSMGYYL